MPCRVFRYLAHCGIRCMDIRCTSTYISCMRLFTPSDKTLASDIAALVYANPFLEERITRERRILGDKYTDKQPYWSLLPDAKREATITAIAARCDVLVQTLRERMRDGARPLREE